jgi:hypothetical protein
MINWTWRWFWRLNEGRLKMKEEFEENPKLTLNKRVWIWRLDWTNKEWTSLNLNLRVRTKIESYVERTKNERDWIWILRWTNEWRRRLKLRLKERTKIEQMNNLRLLNLNQKLLNHLLRCLSEYEIVSEVKWKNSGIWKKKREGMKWIYDISYDGWVETAAILKN